MGEDVPLAVVSITTEDGRPVVGVRTELRRGGEIIDSSVSWHGGVVLFRAWGCTKDDLTICVFPPRSSGGAPVEGAWSVTEGDLARVSVRVPNHWLDEQITLQLGDVALSVPAGDVDDLRAQAESAASGDPVTIGSTTVTADDLLAALDAAAAQTVETLTATAASAPDGNGEVPAASVTS